MSRFMYPPVDSGATPGGAAGAVQYNDGVTLAGSSSLFWDSANSRLGINTAVPDYALDVNGSVDINGYLGIFLPPATPLVTQLQIEASAAGTEGPMIYLKNSGVSSANSRTGIVFSVESGSTFGGVREGEFYAINANPATGATDFVFRTWDGAVEAERFRVGFDRIVIPHNTFLYGRNAADTLDLKIAKITSTDTVEIGDRSGTGTYVELYTNGITICSNSDGDGEIYMQGNSIYMGYAGGVTAPKLKFSNAAESFYVDVKAPDALAASYTLTWPTTAGSAGQVLSTDGNGVLSWITP